MKLMDRYIVRELIIPFIAGSLAIALLFDLNQLIFILKTYSVQNVPVSAMAQMILYRTPFWLNLTLPAGIALAASLAITRLTRESEVTAMRAAGVRLGRILAPVVVFGVFVSIGNYLLVEKVIPKTDQMARRLEVEVGVAAATPAFNSNVWLTLRQYRASLGTVRRQGDEIQITRAILGERPDRETTNFYFAEKGVYRKGVWTFYDPVVWSLKPGGKPKVVRISSRDPKKPGTLTINQPIFVSDMFEQARPQDKTSAELAQIIDQGEAAGRDMTDQKVAYYTRFSSPAACIVFAFVATVLGVRFARTGGFIGVLLSFILVLVYYNAFIISTEVLGKQHWAGPMVAAWLPNALFAIVGVIAARRLE